MCLEEFQTPITCILRNLGFFQRMERGLESGPCSSGPLCALVQGTVQRNRCHLLIYVG